MKKKWLSVVLLLAVQPQLAMAHSIQDITSEEYYYSNPQQGAEVEVIMDGMPLYLGGEDAYKSQRSIMVPLRSVAESMGATVQWNHAEHTAIVTNGGTTIRFPADSKKAFVNGTATELPEKMVIKHDRLFVPMVILKRIAMDNEYNIVYSNQLDQVQIIPNMAPPEELPVDVGENGQVEESPEKQPDQPQPSTDPKEKIVIPSLDSLMSKDN